MELGTNNAVEVMLARMDGKLDRLDDRSTRTEADIAAVRLHQDAQAAALAALMSANLPDKIEVLERRVNTHSHKLDKHATEAAERKGSVNTAKLIWAISGSIITAAIALLGIAASYIGGN